MRSEMHHKHSTRRPSLCPLPIYLRQPSSPPNRGRSSPPPRNNTVLFPLFPAAGVPIHLVHRHMLDGWTDVAAAWQRAVRRGWVSEEQMLWKAG
ncbi:hypothetical protein PSPO01_02472 [Paraphaeosphaeria sporulosa]